MLVIVNEIRNIKVDSVNLNSRLIKIMRKGGKEQYVRIASAKVFCMLKTYEISWYRKEYPVISISSYVYDIFD